MLESSRNSDSLARRSTEAHKGKQVENDNDKRKVRRFTIGSLDKAARTDPGKTDRKSLSVRQGSFVDRMPHFEVVKDPRKLSDNFDIADAAEKEPDLDNTIVVGTAETVKKFSNNAFIKGSSRLLAGFTSVPVLLFSKATAVTFSLATGGIAGLSIPVMTLWSMATSESKEDKINELRHKIALRKDNIERIGITKDQYNCK